MPRVGFEPKIPALERAKTVHALDHAATVTGIFLFAAQPKEFFLDGLKKLEQRSHKCVQLRGE
jgi:hypothetical protein